MVDGSSGLRIGLRKWAEKLLREGRIKSLADLIVAMCYYHIVAAIRQHSAYLPLQSDMGQVLFDIERLAELDPVDFTKAWECVQTEWKAKKWITFLEYFKKTWINQLSGWQINMLGEGTPRTNNGLEGSWPTIHVFIKGIITPIAMLDDILEFIIPYFERNKKTFQLHSKPFSLDERKYAVALSRETSETWLQYSVDKIQWNYCRKRLNGIRTPLTIKDVQDYEEKINQKNWNYEDFVSYINSKI